MRFWLERAEQLAANCATDDPHSLPYLFRTEEKHGFLRLYLRAVKVRRLQAGGYGKEQAFNLGGESRAPFVTSEDKRIMALVRAGRLTTATRYGCAKTPALTCSTPSR